MSRRTKKRVFEDQNQYVLQLLLGNGGYTVDLDRLYRRRNARRVYESVTSTLTMMGIVYRKRPGTLQLRVPNQEELAKDAAMTNALKQISIANQNLAAAYRNVVKPDMSMLLQQISSFSKK